MIHPKIRSGPLDNELRANQPRGATISATTIRPQQDDIGHSKKNHIGHTENQYRPQPYRPKPYLPGYLPGVATPGADIQWTSS